MNIFWSIVIFDLRRVLSDRFAAVWLVILPLFFALIFGLVFQQSPEDERVSLQVFDLDNSSISQLFISNISEDKFIVNIKDELPSIQPKEWTAGVIIPATFSENMMQNLPAELLYIKGNEPPNVVLNIQAHLTEMTIRFIEALLAVENTDDITVLADQLQSELNQPNDVVVDIMKSETLKPPPSGFNLTLPGYLVMFVLQMTLIYGGITLVEDRIEGQYSRLLIAPIPAFAIFIAKILSRIFLSLFQACILLAAGFIFFGIPIGDPLALAVILIVFAACIGAMSILIGMLCSDVPQVTSVAIFLTLTLSPLSGCWWPIEIVPDWLFTVAQYLPTYWCLRGIQDILYYNHGVFDILPIVWILITFTTVFLLISYYQISRVNLSQ